MEILTRILEASPTGPRIPKSTFRWFCMARKTIGLRLSMSMGMAREGSLSRSTIDRHLEEGGIVEGESMMRLSDRGFETFLQDIIVIPC